MAMTNRVLFGCSSVVLIFTPTIKRWETELCNVQDPSPIFWFILMRLYSNKSPGLSDICLNEYIPFYQSETTHSQTEFR